MFEINNELIESYMRIYHAHIDSINERRFYNAENARILAGVLWDSASETERAIITKRTADERRVKTG